MAPEQRRVAIAGFSVFAVYATVSSFFGTWSDEEYTLAATGSGIPYALHRAITYELQAPLYFVVLAGWRELDGSVWFARLFSLLCAGAFFFALVAIARRISPSTNPLPFALLCVFNPFVAFDAMQIRLYALALLISALLYLDFDSGFVRGASTSARVRFIVLAICGTYVQYFLAFMLVGFGCALVVRGKLKELGAYLACSFAAAVAIVPLALVARSQVAGESSPTGASPFSLLYLTLLHPWLEFLYPHPYNRAAEPQFEHYAYAFIAISVAFCWVLARPRISRELAGIVSIAVAIELVYVVFALVLGERLNDRYFVALFVPVAAAAYGLERASTRRPPVPQRIAVATFAVLTAWSLVTHYRFLAQNGDWKRVAAYLSQHARSDDLIAIYPSDSLSAFERQYRGNVRIVPFPRPNPTDRYVIGAVDVNSTDEARVAFSKLPGYRTLWLVDAVRCDASAPEYGCDHLQEAVDAGFKTLANAPFYMNRVEELTRRSGAAP